MNQCNKCKKKFKMILQRVTTSNQLDKSLQKQPRYSSFPTAFGALAVPNTPDK